MARLKLLDPMKARGIKTAPTALEARGIKPAPSKANRSGRDADPRRTIPLNSATWRKLRARVLAEEPLCRMCAARGLVTVATCVDHASGDPSDNSRQNLVSLCEPCHNHKTGRERAGLQAIHGHDEHGMPLDPAHPWNLQCGTEKSPEGDSSKTVLAPSLQRNGRD